MRLSFNDDQLKLLSKINFGFDVQKDLSDDEYLEIDEKVSEYLMVNGFDKGYEPNKIGLICESIMDVLSAE